MVKFLDILSDIKSILLDKIPVFNTGFEYCRVMKDEMQVYENRKPVNITDVEGDYFYIRTNGKTSVSRINATTDCDVKVRKTYPLSLIAVVNGEISEFEIVDAIENELLKTKKIDIRSDEVAIPVIIAEEFKSLGQEATDIITSSLDGKTIVRVDFEIVHYLQTNNCEYSFCKPC